MQIQTERGIICVDRFLRSANEAPSFGASYSFTSHDIDCDCYSKITGENRRVFYLVAKTERAAIRLILTSIFKKSPTIPEDFGNDILDEVCDIIREGSYDITEQMVTEAMLFAYMTKMQ